MQKHLYLLSLVILFGCIKEKTTDYTATIINASNHYIEIHYYNNGIVLPKDILKITQGNQIQIANGFDRGIVDHAGFNPNYRGDSAIVVFDTTYKMVHYLGDVSNPDKKSYLYSSTRNVFNYLSFQYEHNDKSKSKRTATYKYSFTEQDYLDAK